MGFIVTRYRLLIFLCFIHYNVNSHLVHSSHRFPDLFKTDRDEGAKTRVSEGTQTSRFSIKSGHDWRSSDAFMAGQSGDASSETRREKLAWKDSVERRLRDLEMGSRSIPEEQADPEVKREIDNCRGEIKRLTGEVIQVRRELEAAKTELKDVKNALTTINSDREAQIDKHMTAHGTQESITNPIGHVTDDDLKAFKDAHGELKTKLDHQDETILNLNKTKGNGVVELKKELYNQVSSEQEASTKLHVSMDHLIHDTIFENLKVAIDSQYIKSTASPTKRRRRRDGISALTTLITSFLSELQQYNKTIQDEKTELMRMSQDSVTGNDVVKLEKWQTDVRTLAQNLAKTETVLDLLHVGLREEKRFVRSHFDAIKESLNSFINQRDLLETNMSETTDRLTSVSDALSNVMMAVDSVSTSIWTFRDNYTSSTNAQIAEIKDDVDTLKMLYKRNRPCYIGNALNMQSVIDSSQDIVDRTVVNDGTIVLFSCINGYVFDSEEEHIRSTCSRGHINIPECKDTSCSNLQNGTVLYKNSRPIVTCDEGFSLHVNEHSIECIDGALQTHRGREVVCFPAVCSVPCKYEGVCIRDNVCNCPAGTHLPNCDADPCYIGNTPNMQSVIESSQDVVNGPLKDGTIVLFSCINGYVFDSEEEHIRRTCSRGHINIPECIEQTCQPPCQNGGTCVNGQCQCSANTAGNACQTVYCPKPDRKHYVPEKTAYYPGDTIEAICCTDENKCEVSRDECQKDGSWRVGGSCREDCFQVAGNIPRWSRIGGSYQSYSGANSIISCFIACLKHDQCQSAAFSHAQNLCTFIYATPNNSDFFRTQEYNYYQTAFC